MSGLVIAALVLIVVFAAPWAGGARVRVDGRYVTVAMTGMDRLYALKSRLRIPLDHVVEARVEPHPLRQRVGTRLPGTAIPGLYVAGSYRRAGKWTFMDTRRGPALDLRLRGEHYERVLVQVDDPQGAADAINAGRRPF